MSMATRNAPASSASAALSAAAAPAADHADRLSAEVRKIDGVAAMRPIMPVETLQRLRHERPTKAVTPRGQHHAARRQAALARRRLEVEGDRLPVAFDTGDLHLVFDRNVDHAAPFRRR
jgi:hypothetical protein